MSHPLSEHAVWARQDRDGTRHQVFVMYHATSRENALNIISEGRLRPSKDGMLGPGVYASHTYQKAFNHGRATNDGHFVVFKLLVYVGRVKAVRRKNDPLRKTWHRDYDSAWFPPKGNPEMSKSGLQENSIKSPRNVHILGVCLGSPLLDYDDRVAHYPRAPRKGYHTCLRHDAEESNDPRIVDELEDFVDMVVPDDHSDYGGGYYMSGLVYAV